MKTYLVAIRSNCTFLSGTTATSVAENALADSSACVAVTFAWDFPLTRISKLKSPEAEPRNANQYDLRRFYREIRRKRMHAKS